MIGLATLLQVVAGGGAINTTAKVGDTIWVTRTVTVAPRQTVRPTDWTPPDPVESVSRPTVTVRGSTVDIQYPLTVWRAGRHRIEIPGPLVLGSDGTADSLPSYVTTLTIASVLPVVPADSTIAPQPRAAVVPRRGVSLVPLLVLWALSLVLLLPFRWWWRRRGKPGASPVRAAPAAAAPVDRWMELGERRAVASLAATRLRATLAALPTGPDAGVEAEARDLLEARELLEALDQARFGTAADDVMQLLRRAEQLERRVAQAGVVAAP